MAVTCEEPCRLDTGGAVVAGVAEVPADGAGPGMSRLGLILFLGALCAIGPLAIDMYLPSFPRVASDLGVSLGLVERTLAVYFIGLAFGQLLYGPVSDRLGERGRCIWALACSRWRRWDARLRRAWRCSSRCGSARRWVGAR